MTTEKKPAQKRKAAPQRAAVDSPPIDGAAPLNDESVPIVEFHARGEKTVTLLRCEVDGHESVENPCPVCGTNKEIS